MHTQASCGIARKAEIYFGILLFSVVSRELTTARKHVVKEQCLDKYHVAEGWGRPRRMGDGEVGSLISLRRYH